MGQTSRMEVETAVSNFAKCEGSFLLLAIISAGFLPFEIKDLQLAYRVHYSYFSLHFCRLKNHTPIAKLSTRCK